MCREPGRHSTLDKGHEEGGSAYANAGSSLRCSPGYSRASPPQKNQRLPIVLLCELNSDFTGGCPPPPSRSLCQRVNLQLQFIKFLDRKSTRLNSSHQLISYAVFCLKKKKNKASTNDAEKTKIMEYLRTANDGYL